MQGSKPLIPMLNLNKVPVPIDSTKQEDKPLEDLVAMDTGKLASPNHGEFVDGQDAEKAGLEMSFSGRMDEEERRDENP